MQPQKATITTVSNTIQKPAVLMRNNALKQHTRFRLVIFTLFCLLAACVYVGILWYRGEIIPTSATKRTVSVAHSYAFAQPVYPTNGTPVQIVVYARSAENLPVAGVLTSLNVPAPLETTPTRLVTDATGKATFQVRNPANTTSTMYNVVVSLKDIQLSQILHLEWR